MKSLVTGVPDDTFMTSAEDTSWVRYRGAPCIIASIGEIPDAR
jgi:hypothetical protein